MYDRVPWENLKARIARTWKQGQHVVVCAPTGRGKTVLIQQLLPLRSHVVFFGTKIKDDEYNVLIKDYRFSRLQTWPPKPWINRAMLWPRPERTIRETQARQKAIFTDALDTLFRRGNWTVCLDELHWMASDLGLYKEIASLHHQGRSSGLTLIDGFQRPAYVPRIVYSSASHMFLWGTTDPADLKSIAAFTGTPVKVWQQVMTSLTEYEFVYVNVRDIKQPPVISQVKR